MEVGLIGVGKMGMGLLKRWQTAGHTVITHDVAATAAEKVKAVNAVLYPELEHFVAALTVPRRIWLMVPAATVPSVIDELAARLDAGDTVIDGGNSFFKDSHHHAVKLDKRGVHFIDVGVSGGLAGESTGYALMVGGNPNHIAAIEDLLTSLAAPGAYLQAGPAGAGHFVKMVHNAIEYGMMQAIGEGFELLKKGPFPDLKLADIANVWSHGTIIRSYLLELTARALSKDTNLKDIAAYVEDSGEGRWSVATAVEHGVPFAANTAALYARFDSRQPDLYTYRLLAALRKEFGGHAVKKDH